MDHDKKEEIRAVIANAAIVYVSSVDEAGYPNVKAMFARRQDGVRIHYMTTNYSSKRTQQFKNNNKSSIYYCEESAFKGVILIGHMEICTDHATKVLIWKDGDVIYYPQGVDDPDYCVYRFVAERGNYYHGLKNIDFDIAELEESAS